MNPGDERELYDDLAMMGYWPDVPHVTIDPMGPDAWRALETARVRRAMRGLDTQPVEDYGGLPRSDVGGRVRRGVAHSRLWYGERT